VRVPESPEPACGESTHTQPTRGPHRVRSRGARRRCCPCRPSSVYLAALNRTPKAPAGRPVRHCGSVEIGWLRQGWLALLGGLIVPCSGAMEAEDTMRLMFGKGTHLHRQPRHRSAGLSRRRFHTSNAEGDEAVWQRGFRDRNTLDGWRSSSDKDDPAPDHVRRAVENAIPAAFHDRW
jgi:hypothetical protein